MKRWNGLLLAAGLAMAVSACAGDRSPDADTATTGTPQGDAVGTAGAANADREFVSEQLAKGNAEVELGQLAQQRGSHPEVKRYGEMMVRDHRMAGDELKQIAASTSANPAQAAGDHGDHSEIREELAKLSGRDFDRRYIDQMVEDHEKAVREVEAKAERGENPEIRQWASKTLPKLREHLEQAKAIQETLQKDNTDYKK